MMSSASKEAAAGASEGLAPPWEEEADAPKKTQTIPRPTGEWAAEDLFGIPGGEWQGVKEVRSQGRWQGAGETMDCGARAARTRVRQMDHGLSIAADQHGSCCAIAALLRLACLEREAERG